MQKKTKMVLQGIWKSFLVMLPALLGFGWVLFSKGPVGDIRFSLGFFIAGFTGVIIAIRKEIPMSIGSIRGKWAVIQGITFTILLWGSALLILFVD